MILNKRVDDFISSDQIIIISEDVIFMADEMEIVPEIVLFKRESIEVELVFIDFIKVSLDEVVPPQPLDKLVLPDVTPSSFYFIPHGLQIMRVAVLLHEVLVSLVTLSN